MHVQPGARMYAQTFACVRMCALSTLSMQLYHTVSGSASLHAASAFVHARF